MMMTSGRPTAAAAAAAVLLAAIVVADFVSVAQSNKASKPNIVWFLTDDQDQMLGSSFPDHGVTPMAKTKSLMVDGGATATNFFIHTPICCPSRSELLSGRYFHNIKTTQTPESKDCGCMHINDTKVNSATFARYLKEEAGYTVGMFGKYLNRMPSPKTGGPGSSAKNNTVVPAGFDAWLGNGGGDYIAPSFNTQNISFGGFDLEDGVWRGTSDNYTTAVVGNVSIAWIKHVVAENPNRPFFAYVAPKAAHEPFNPAPWYRTVWDSSWPTSEPRSNPAWNCSAESREDHHGNIASEDMLTTEAAMVISDVFKNRWRTLMSVDDVIGDVIATVDSLGLSDNTYFFYSSDHGFQLGEFNIIMDKRQPYDWDTRIHLLARGPGIKSGSTWSQPATQVDMAPTFLGLAGLDKAPQMDGKSLVPLLMPEVFTSAARNSARQSTVTSSTAKHLEALLSKLPKNDAKAYANLWRKEAFIEYYFNDPNVKCVGSCDRIPTAATGYPHADTYCGDLTPGAYAHCWAQYGCNTQCYPTESNANNFIVLRSMNDSDFGNKMYAEFQTGDQCQSNIDFANPDFHELYDADVDPWMMKNLYNSTSPDILEALHNRLHVYATCAGDACP